MTPVWGFPIYPMLISLPMVTTIAPAQTPAHSQEMVLVETAFVETA